MQNVQLIESLQKCIRECLNCADSCLDEDNIKKMVPCVRLDRACAETCQAGANLLAINATNAREMVQLCKDICSKCADECEKHEMDHCKRCGEACRECEKACEAYLG
ncbi:MAG: four-helix bundle copper-binding protein [Owenweeksia sp.]|nr:four-helix bundle copper-binding protein [Owenweeksia sp.]MBF99589.1 four-helix bundle copper-binding protein [Owenweeksia sp.]HBF20390.1 four-helix bundle copper-binding protein [Cryomorphaceae bacterium]HCQ14644.1 four-helix bundle copper-binding protein [Cryomorphaceae bacterium]|tara:strand:- start:62 stop:382 length:321 start_codon:yes stop_codon:yes gene_type:complete